MTSSKPKHFPRIFYIFYAIVVFKRLITARRKWKSRHDNVKVTTAKSALLNEIQKSQVAVKYASFGRPVITSSIDSMRKLSYFKDSTFSNNGKDKENLTSIMQTARVSTADKIRQLRSSFSSVYETDMKRKVVVSKETGYKDISNVLIKNRHISKPVTQSNQNPSKIRHYLKSMKKMDLQDVLNYATGTAVYFGATVALQSRHGGYLSFNQSFDIKASAYKIFPSSRFVIWNCDDLTDHGIVRFGDAVWLQSGLYEVLGAQYGGPITQDKTRKIQPAIVNCRRENFFKAQQYGRWIILNRKNPTSTLGEQVLHHDLIMLEQEWCFLASNTPYDAYMEQKTSFEGAESGGNPDYFNPIEQCSWKLHIVTLPSDDNPDSRFREYLLTQAKDQIKLSVQERRKKENVLRGPFSKDIPHHLQPSTVVARDLPHTRSPELRQRHLLSKFDKQLAKDFRVDGPNIHTLRALYGSESTVFKNAINSSKIIENISDANSNLENLSNKLQVENLSLIEAEDSYWQVANNVLMDSNSWIHLPSSMKRFYEMDYKVKDRAARVIQKFLKKKIINFFSWRRTFNQIDKARSNKIRMLKLSDAEDEYYGGDNKDDIPNTFHASLNKGTNILNRPESAPHFRKSISDCEVNVLFDDSRPCTAPMNFSHFSRGDTRIRDLSQEKFASSVKASPQTMNISKAKRKKVESNLMYESLVKSKDRKHGLPKDVFLDHHCQLSVSTSLRFLKASAISSNHLYDGIKTRKKKPGLLS